MCSWIRCNKAGDYIAVADRNVGTYHLCHSHWERVCKVHGDRSIQETLGMLARPSVPELEHERGMRK